MPDPSPRRATAVATRRTALGCGVLALTTVSGCDLGRTGGPADGPVPTAAATSTEDPDTALLEEILTELDSMVALVTESTAGSRKLRTPLVALRDLHLAHAAALGADLPDSAPTPAPGEGSGSTRSRVVTRERRLQRRLADWSVAAESGTLARLLASMSAAVAQHVVHHLGEDSAGRPGSGTTSGEGS